MRILALYESCRTCLRFVLSAVCAHTLNVRALIALGTYLPGSLARCVGKANNSNGMFALNLWFFESHNGSTFKNQCLQLAKRHHMHCTPIVQVPWFANRTPSTPTYCAVTHLFAQSWAGQRSVTRRVDVPTFLILENKALGMKSFSFQRQSRYKCTVGGVGSHTRDVDPHWPFTSAVCPWLLSAFPSVNKKRKRSFRHALHTCT